MRSVRHIVWDWNGTLFNDHEAVWRAANASLGRIGVPSLTRERYRELFCRPVQLFYERAAGRSLGEPEWRLIDEEFHRAYRTSLATCGLAEGARQLLDSWPDDVRSQSLLSMWDHEELIPLVRLMGISDVFLRIDGRVGSSGGLKAANLVRHLEELSLDAADVGLIGDSLDDADAARSVGAACVLCRGSHDERSLAAAGVPVVDTLADAVALLGMSR